MNKKLNRIGLTLIIVGLSVFGYFKFAELYASAQEKRLLEQFVDNTKDYVQDHIVTTNNSSMYYQLGWQSRAVANPSQWSEKDSDNGAFAKLTIPAINAVLPVVRGTGKAELRYAVGHVIGTKEPGQLGNIALAAHRSYTDGKLFNRLDELKTNDLIIVETELYEFTYSVQEIMIVDPTEVWVLDDVEEESTITLITCTPMYSSESRLIVRGYLQNRE